MQHLMGIEGVIVDLVQEITEAVSDMIKPTIVEDRGDKNLLEGDGKMQMQLKSKPEFSQRELSFLLKLIPEMLGYFKEIDSPPPFRTNCIAVSHKLHCSFAQTALQFRTNCIAVSKTAL
ncbi:unnamed protein product [Prunus armeniaca]